MDLDGADEEEDEEPLGEVDVTEALAGTWRRMVANLRAEGYTDLAIAHSLVTVGHELLWDLVDEESFGDADGLN